MEESEMAEFEVIDTAENKRVIKFNEKQVTLNRDEANSLWTFSWSSGEPPEVLSGMFTNPSVAYEFLRNYLDNLEKSKKKAKV